MSTGLANKVVVVTGASQGIGRATAERFAEEGARVALSDMTGDVIAVAEALAREHPSSRAFGVVTDVTHPHACEALIAAARDRLGGLDVLAIAGAVLQKKGPLAELAPEEWDRVMAVNAKGPFLLCRSAIPVLTRPGGRIVILASFAGEVGQTGFSAYSASKGAVRIMTQSLALEVADVGITVNSVAPAYVQSAMGDQALAVTSASTGQTVEQVRQERDAKIPLRRQATAREIAETMLFLGSPASAYMTGACLDVNGGFVLR